MSSKGASPASSGPPKTISSLPPDLIIRIFTYLPIPDLPTIAQVSRRFKILAYNDSIYHPKLKCLGVSLEDDAWQGGGTGNAGGSDAGGGAGADGVGGAKGGVSRSSSSNSLDLLNTRLKQLPGGHMFPGSTKYLEEGSLWGGMATEELAPPRPSIAGRSRRNSEAVQPQGSLIQVEVAAAGMGKGEGVLTKSEDDMKAIAEESQPQEPAQKESPPAAQQQKITAELPGVKKSFITIGSGGLKALRQQNNKNAPAVPVVGGMKRSASQFANRAKYGHVARETFKQAYMELKPYYLDFEKRQKDSKVFKDHKDVVEIATILRRLRLFSAAKFIANSDDIQFALETTIEWFESMVLGQFERAYDKEDISEMKKAALACFQLNGGMPCVQLFISKNPIFFDHTFNPTLVAAKLPAVTGASTGYMLADDFAKFMDHMLNMSKKQAVLIGQVFVPDMDAMTLFVTKVLEDPIAEYLSATLSAAKQREGAGIYLHTLAASFHCCVQYSDYVCNNGHCYVNSDKIKDALSTICRPYVESYITMEKEHMQSRFKKELDKWNKAKERRRKVANPAAYLADQEKTMAHKRAVMNTFKMVLFAPVKAVTSVTQGLTNNRVKPSQQQSLLENAEPVLNDNGSDHDSGGAVTYHLDDDSMNSLVSLEFCLQILHTNKESLGRCLVVTAATDLTKLKTNVEKVFVPLLKTIGEEHIKPAFTSAIDRLSQSRPVDTLFLEGDPKNGNTISTAADLDSMQFFELVHIADLVSQMVDVYYQEDVKPWIDENDFLAEIVVEKRNFDRLLDDQVATGLDKSIQVLINQAEYILSHDQLPTDFNPPEKNVVVDIKPTKACTKVIRCLTAHTRLLTGVADRNMMEVFYGELGVRMFNLIIKTIKSRQISQQGAMQLICDLNRYYEWASSVRVPSVAKQFSVLKELGSLFLADGNNELRGLVHDVQRYQGHLRLEEILELLSSRTDYKQIQKYVESKECIIQ
ncbi:F-box protein: endocytic membrane traffic, recycling ReCYcling 1 [Quaeritorhiza haematococci]|nr:F-box protein: endocytic membrane traffic, recycling ReCYcling 1 [Quaeritorhiza haematococci]